MRVREAHLSVGGCAGRRYLLGVVGLPTLWCMRPPYVGRHDPRGLLYSFHQAEQYAVGEPLRRFMGHVVIPHFTLFGWQVFLVEAVAGVLLLLGWHTRIGAVIGLFQAIAITLLTARAPNQWFWGFVLFIAVSLLIAVVPSNRHLSLDRRQGRA